VIVKQVNIKNQLVNRNVTFALWTKHLEMDFQAVFCAALVHIGYLTQVHVQHVRNPHINHKQEVQCANPV